MFYVQETTFVLNADLFLNTYYIRRTSVKHHTALTSMQSFQSSHYLDEIYYISTSILQELITHQYFNLWFVVVLYSMNIFPTFSLSYT